MKKLNKVKVLDCTLRDGGYYNNWDFSSQIAQDYLNAMSKSGIKFVELGFRSLSKKGFKGPNWYTTESYIDSLSVPKNISLGVMVNVFEITSHHLGLKKTTDLLFKNSKFSKIKFVRLASHFDEFVQATKICKILKNKGYIVGINLMQISERSEKDILSAAKKAQEAKPDILYFADSLGSMNEQKIKKVINSLKKFWKGELGIHAHNNLGKALANSLFALEHGVSWVDSTVTGMGRGPGNVQTEFLLLEMEKYSKTKFDVLPVIKIIEKYFEPLKKIYNWGTNPFYYLAGKYGIHPTYIQEMISQKLNEIKILETINQLKEKNGNKYDINLVRSEFQKPIKLTRGVWSPKKKFKNKEVMFISSGPNLFEYKEAIKKYILKNKPIVVALKPSVKIDSKLIDYYIACNPLRLMSEASSYKTIKSPLIIPKSLMTEKLKQKLKNIKILDFGIGLKDNKFEFYNNCAMVPKLYTVAYALSLAASGKASKILLAGFDGYGKNDKRTKIVDELFLNYSSHKKSKPIICITPTSYSFTNTSIYAL